MSEIDIFNNIFNKYKNTDDKYESLYIFITNGLDLLDLKDNVSKILKIFDDITNSSKKNFLKKRMYEFSNFLEGIVDFNIANVFIVGQSVESIPMDKYWIDTLNMFNCNKYYCKYGKEYQIDWLKHLLLDRSYVNVLHVRNNTLKHIYLNHTKKKVVYEKTEKKLDINEYISENILKNDTCIIHGISSSFKSIEETLFIKILNGEYKDDDILHEYDKLVNYKLMDDLKWWLDRLTDPKESKKIVFGIDIKHAINSKLLKTLYCSPVVCDKIKEKVLNDLQIFDIVSIKSFGTDIGYQLEKDFSGAVGIKFY